MERGTRLSMIVSGYDDDDRYERKEDEPGESMNEQRKRRACCVYFSSFMHALVLMLFPLKQRNS